MGCFPNWTSTQSNKLYNWSKLGGITALTVGPAAAADALRKALQMGVNSAVHVEDDSIAGSDVLGTSLVLAEAIKRLEYDVVLFGMASTDAGGGGYPPLSPTDWGCRPFLRLETERRRVDGENWPRR